MQFELCPCLDSIFAGVPDDAALRTLADLGFRHFEFWDWRSHDLAAITRARDAYDLRPAAFSANTFAEPLVSSDIHVAALDHIRRSVALASDLGTKALVIHVGFTVAGATEEQQWHAAVTGLRRAGEIAAQSGVSLLVEPLNTAVDHPGYFLDTLSQSRRLLADVEHPSVRLLLDVYHLWVMHDDLLNLLPDAVTLTGHVHLADAPGRHEPGTGSIPWPAVMSTLTEHGYSGLLGLEYWPSANPAASLVQTRDFLRNASTRSSRSIRSTDTAVRFPTGRTGTTGETG